MITLIVEAALRSCALGLLVWLALALARPSNPHLHKTVWLSVVVASFAMPVLIGFSLAPRVPAPMYLVTLSANGLTLGAGGPTLVPLPTSALARLTEVATGVYALVALVLLARFATGFLRMWRIRHGARVLREPWVQSDDVRASAMLLTPATFGSTILLPEEVTEWSEQKRAAVMAHERSHVRRGDCYMLWLARLHTCFFWINPLAWWMQSRLAALAETTSDDAVVAELGDRPAYAEVLLEIATAHPVALVSAAAEMAGPQQHIAARIERIVSEIAPSVAPKRRYQMLAVALLLPAVVASAASLAPPRRLAQATPSQTGAAADDFAPKFISGDTDLEKYYPVEAKRKGIEGMVKIAITVDAEGRPTDTLILDEHPLEVGFGAAASALAHTFRFSNPAHKPAQVPMAFKFELQGHGNPLQALPPPQSPAGG